MVDLKRLGRVLVLQRDLVRDVLLRCTGCCCCRPPPRCCCWLLLLAVLLLPVVPCWLVVQP